MLASLWNSRERSSLRVSCRIRLEDCTRLKILASLFNYSDFFASSAPYFVSLVSRSQIWSFLLKLRYCLRRNDSKLEVACWRTFVDLIYLFMSSTPSLEISLELEPVLSISFFTFSWHSGSVWASHPTVPGLFPLIDDKVNPKKQKSFF